MGTQEILGISTSQISTLTSQQVAVLSATQINALTTGQIKALQSQQIKGISADKIPELRTFIKKLSSTQIKGLATNALSALTSQALKALSVDEILGLLTLQIAMAAPATGTKTTAATSNLMRIAAATATKNLSSLTTQEIVQLTKEQIAAFQQSEITTLTSSQLQVLSTQQISGFTTVQISAMATGQLNAFSSTQIPGLTSQQITSLTTGQIVNLRNEFITSLSGAQGLALTTNQIKILRTDQVGALSTDVFSQLRKDQIATLSVAQVNAIETEDIASLSDMGTTGLTTADINNLSNIQIKALKTSGLASLNSQQINALGTRGISALEGNQIATLTNFQISALNTSNLASLQTSQIKNIQSNQIIALTSAQLSALKSDQLRALTTTQINTFTASQFKKFTTGQLNSFTNIQISGWNSQQISSLSTVQISALTTELVNEFKGNQGLALTSSQIKALTTAQVVALNTQVFGQLRKDQIEALSSTQIKYIETADIASINASAIKGMSTTGASVLNSAQVQAIQTASLAALSTAQINALASNSIAALTTAQVKALDNDQIAGLSNSTIANLQAIQIQALKTTQTNALTKPQINALSSSQIAALSTQAFSSFGSSQITAFTTNQIRAIQTQGIASLTNAGIRYLLTQQIAAMSSAQVNAISTKGINALSTSQIVALGSNVAAFGVDSKPSIMFANGRTTIPGSAVTITANISGNTEPSTLGTLTIGGSFIGDTSSWIASYTPQVQLQKIVSTDNTIKLGYDTSTDVYKADNRAGINGMPFFNGEAGSNVIHPDVPGTDKISLVSTRPNFSGATLLVQLENTSSEGVIATPVVRFSNRIGIFSNNTDSGGNIYYQADGKYSGSTVTAGNTTAVNQWEIGESVIKGSQTVLIGQVQYSEDNQSIKVVLNENATAEVVQSLISDIKLGMVDITGVNSTADWGTAPINTNVKVTLKVADSEDMTFSKNVIFQPVPQTSAPLIKVFRYDGTVDEDTANSGRLIAFNGAQGINITNPSFAGKWIIINDKEQDYSGGSLKLSFIQGSTSYSNMGLVSANDGSRPFKVDWATGNITYFSGAKIYGSTTVTSDGVIHLTNTPDLQGSVRSAGVLIGTLDATHRGFKGDDLIIHFNENANNGIVELLASQISHYVRDPASGQATQNWSGVAGNKLIEFTLTDTAGNERKTQQQMVVVSHPEDDNGVVLTTATVNPGMNMGSGRDISAYLTDLGLTTSTGNQQEHLIRIGAGAGIANADITVRIQGTLPSSFSGQTFQLDLVTTPSSQSQTEMLDAFQIVAMLPQQIAALKSEQIAAFTSEQINALKLSQILTLSTSQVAAINSEAIKYLQTSMIAALKTDQIRAIETIDLAAININGFRALTGSQVAAFTTEQVAALTSTEVLALQSNQLTMFSSAQISALTSSQVKALTQDQWAILTGDQIKGIDSQDLALLSSNQISNWKPSQIAALQSGQIAALSEVQISGLSSTHIRALSTQAITGLSAAQLSQIKGAQFSGLSSSQLKSMTVAQLNGLRYGAGFALNVIQTGGLSTSQKNALLVKTPAEVSPLTSASLAAFDTDQIRSIQPDAIRQLTTLQLPGLSSQDFAAMSPLQIKALGTTNIKALSTQQIQGITTAGIAALSSAQVSQLSTSQLASLRLDQVRAIGSEQMAGFSVTQLSGMWREQLACLSEDSLSSLSLAQRADIKSNLSVTKQVVLDKLMIQDEIILNSDSPRFEFIRVSTQPDLTLNWYSGFEPLKERPPGTIFTDGTPEMNATNTKLLDSFYNDQGGYYMGMNNSDGQWVYKLMTPALKGKQLRSIWTYSQTSAMIASSSTYSERQNLATQEFGANTGLADFTDVAQLASLFGASKTTDFLNIRDYDNPNIPGTSKDPLGNEGPFVTYGGSTTQGRFGSIKDASGNSYFIASHNGDPATGSDRVGTAGNTQLDLGTSSADRHVLATIQLAGTYMSLASISKIKPTDIAKWGASDIKVLSPEQFRYLSTEQLRFFNSTSMAALSAAQLERMTETQWQSFNPTQIKWIKPTTMGSLSPVQLKNWSPLQVAALSSTQLAAIAPTTFSNLSAPQLSAIKTAQARGITSVQLSNLSHSQLSAFAPDVVSHFTPIQINNLETPQQLILYKPKADDILHFNANVPEYKGLVVVVNSDTPTALNTIVYTGMRDSYTNEWYYKLYDNFNNDLKGQAIGKIMTLAHTQTVMSAISTSQERLATVQREFGNGAQLASFYDVQNLVNLRGTDRAIDFLDLKSVNLPGIPDVGSDPFALEGPMVLFDGLTSPPGADQGVGNYVISAQNGTFNGWTNSPVAQIQQSQIEVRTLSYDRQVLANIDLTQSLVDRIRFFDAKENDGIDMQINAASGTINGVTHPINPWATFLNAGQGGQFQTLGFTGGENSNGGSLVVNNTSISIPAYDAAVSKDPTYWNKLIAQSVMDQLKAAQSFNDKSIFIKDNTLLILSPRNESLQLNITNSNNSAVNSLVNVPSDLVNTATNGSIRANYRSNPWTSLLNWQPGAFTTATFTGSDLSNGKNIVVLGIDVSLADFKPSANSSLGSSDNQLAEWVRSTLISNQNFQNIRIERKDSTLLFLHNG